jgi:hypothetical protein
MAVTIHGHTGKRVQSPTYGSWHNMKKRCDEPSCPSYKWYGGVGIGYAARWAEFANFLEDMGERPSGMTLDRIDSGKDYSPENCRWATIREQNNNKRNSRVVQYAGKGWAVADLATHLGLEFNTMWSRVKRGWPIEKIIKPVGKPRGMHARSP